MAGNALTVGRGARVLRVAAMVAISVGFGFGCTAKASVKVGKSEVSKEDVQTQVATELANSLHQPTPTITCPGGLEAKVGASVDCDLTAQGDTTKYPVHVVVDSVKDGTAHFNAEVGQQPEG